MSTKIFLGNVADFTEESCVRPLFEKFGRVTECDILTNFGFVHMENEEEAKAAIEAINGRTLNGRELNVQLSTNPARRGRGGGGGGRGDGGGRMRGRGRGFGTPGRGRGGSFDYPPQHNDYRERFLPPSPYDRYDPYGRAAYDRYEDYYRSRAYADAYERQAYGRYSPPPYERHPYPARGSPPPPRDPYARQSADYYDRPRSYYDDRRPY